MSTSEALRVTFHGATETVTGSQTLVASPTSRVLVDCGMFQGFKRLRERNWRVPTYDAESLDAVVLTHAHLDHSGWLPRLVRLGFRGPIVCSPATADLLQILLLDAAHLQEEDARRANRRKTSRHDPALPLYTTEDAQEALALMHPVPMDEPFSFGDISGRLLPVGHMLGAASVRLARAGRSVLFSGDVGRPSDLLMRPPRPFEGADLLVVESTYGNRLHESEDAASRLAEIVNRVCGRGGVLMIPAFAVGRSQAVMHLLAELLEQGRIPQVPVYLNSPMAIDASRIFCRHPEGHRLAESQCRRMCGIAEYVRTAERSKELNERGGPMILIAGSGMATGGRILHHLKAYAGDRKNGILLVGFQAGGTRGALLAEGADSLKIHGQRVRVRAERFMMRGLSGHADWRELIRWMSGAPAPSCIRINHGERRAAEAMRVHLAEELGWHAKVAHDLESIDV